MCLSPCVQLLTGHEQARDERERIEDQLRKTALKLKKEKKMKAKLREERAKAEEAKVIIKLDID